MITISDGTEKECQIGDFVEVSLFSNGKNNLFEVFDIIDGQMFHIKLNEQDVFLSPFFVDAIYRKV